MGLARKDFLKKHVDLYRTQKHPANIVIFQLNGIIFC